MCEKIPNIELLLLGVLTLKIWLQQDTGWSLLEVFLVITNHFPDEYLHMFCPHE